MQDNEVTSLRDELAAGFDSADTAPPAADPGATDTSAPPANGAVSGEPVVTLEPPKHWAEADRGLFSKAPREIQQRWLSREDEIQKGFTKHGQELSQYKKDREAWDEAFRSIDQELKLNGLSRHQYVQNLLAWNDYLTKDPAAALRRLAEQLRVDPKALTDNPQATTTDPNLQKALSRVDELSQRITERERKEHEERMQRHRSTVEEFANAKDAKGEPLHPHFDDVAEDIARLMRADRRLSLETAYNKALRLNDTVWEKTQAARAQAEAQRKEQERKDQVAKARRAAVGSSGEGNGAAAPKTLRDELAAGFANYG